MQALLQGQQYYSHTKVNDIFNLTSNKNIINFITNINLYMTKIVILECEI